MTLVLLGWLVVVGQSSLVEISNTVPRRDASGELMDVHDGNIFFHDGLYHWFGMGYNNCTETTGVIPPFNCPGIYQKFGGCGFRTDHAVRYYSSPDLSSWKLQSLNVLPVSSRPNGIYYRPKVVFNTQTKLFVLWVNLLPYSADESPLQVYPHAVYLVASSAQLAGPFVVRTKQAAVAHSGGGDFTVFIDTRDTRRTAYIAYDAWSNNHVVTIEQLTPDYLDSKGSSFSSGPLSPAGNEAPIVFERGGYFYLLFGPTCCFCSEGSGSVVLTAESPLGPYSATRHLDLNPSHGIFKGRTIKAQENFVITVPFPSSSLSTSSSNGSHSWQFVYTGDRWASAEDKLKSHDFQYWFPLVFNDTTVPAEICPLQWVDSFTLNSAE